MTNNTSRKVVRRQRRNPLIRPKVRVPRPMVNFDGQFLNGTHVYIPDTTAVNTSHHIFFVDCGTVSSNAGFIVKESVPINLDSITGKYNEYVYESLQLEWIPAVAPGVADGGSQIMVTYIDNPEQMVGVNVMTTAQAISMNTLVRNMRSFNAWERMSINVPLSRRIKTFNVNSTGTVVSDINAVSRSIQGLVLVTYQSVNSSVVLGSWRSRYRIKLMGLNYGQAT